MEVKNENGTLLLFINIYFYFISYRVKNIKLRSNIIAENIMSCDDFFDNYYFLQVFVEFLVAGSHN